MKKSVKRTKVHLVLTSSAKLRLRVYAAFLLFGLAMVLRGGEWLVLPGAVLIADYVYYLRRLPKKTVLYDFYAGGVIICGFANIFLFQMAPQNWSIILTGWFAVLSRAIAWVLVTSFCGLSFLALGWVLQRINASLVRVLVLPFAWAVSEVIKSYLYAIMSYGPGSSLSPNFNWGALAVPVAGTPLVFTSRWVGFFGLSVVVLLLGISIYFLATKKHLRFGLVIVAAITSMTAITWQLGSVKSDRSINVALLHLHEKDDLVTLDNVTLPENTSDLFVLPEYSNITKGPHTRDLTSRLSENGVLVTTEDIGKSPASTNQIQYFNKNGNTVNKQDKTFLIPTGEFIPYSLQFSFWLLGQQKIMEDFSYTQQLRKGSQPEKVYESGELAVGTLACSGVSALSQYRGLAKEGADVLVNSASLAFLQPNSLYHVYARNMSRFHAVSNSKPFVQASRSGQSYVLDKQGKTLVEQQGSKSQLLETSVDL